MIIALLLEAVCYLIGIIKKPETIMGRITNIKEKIFLTVSGFVGIGSLLKVVNLGHIGIKQHRLLANICVILSIVCFLPWVVFARKKLILWQPGASKAWKWGVRILLSAAILIGPVITGLVVLWMKIEKPTDAWGGFGPGILAAALVFSSHAAGIGLWAVAFMIQLCRNQWQKILNTLAIAYHLLAIVLSWKITGQF